MIATNSIVVASSKQRYSKLEQEVVILSLKSESYYSLNTVGAEVWSLIQESRSVNEIMTLLLAKYEVDLQQCQSDLLALLGELSAVDLIEVSPETVASEKLVSEIDKTASEARKVWSTPELASYGTMASLVHSSGGSVGDAGMVGLVNSPYPTYDPVYGGGDSPPAVVPTDTGVPGGTGDDAIAGGDDYTN